MNIKNKLLKDFYFSYSGLSSYEQCAYSFKLSYIDKVERRGNFWSDYGNLIHLVLEKYFRGELEIWELLDFYKQEYNNSVKELPPPFIKPDTYYQSGYKFFENFNLDRDEYDIIETEDFVRGTDNGINFIIRPDLIFIEKSSGDIIIMDFKTSEIVDKNGQLDEHKLNGYKKQIGIYIYYIWQFKGLAIKKAKLWFIRSNTHYEWIYNEYGNIEDVEWVKSTIQKISEEKEWKANTNNKFFCCNLCSVAKSCKYKKC